MIDKVSRKDYLQSQQAVVGKDYWFSISSAEQISFEQAGFIYCCWCSEISGEHWPNININERPECQKLHGFDMDVSSSGNSL